MKSLAATTLVLALAAPAMPATSEPDVRRDATVLAVQRVMPSVVNIATEEIVQINDPIEDMFRQFFDPYYRRRQPNAQYSLGSGVLIDEEGYVLTNFHVVGRARRVWVRLSDGREYECQKIGGNSATDVALLKILPKKDETAAPQFTAAKFAGDDDLLLGETVIALGNPFGLGGSVSRGILSSKTRRPPRENERLDVPDWLQTDAAINPGNSGGPLINLRGEVIGINVAVLGQGQGIGFAIPVKQVTQKIAEIVSPELLGSLWFGAQVRPGALPLVISAVQLDSPAGRAGLRAGDRILQVNGRAPRSFIEFNRTLLDAGDRRDVALVVQRDGARRNVTVRLVAEKSFFNAELVRQRIGATVQEFTPELAEAMGLPRATGVLVSSVDLGSPAAQADLQRGMVITSIDGQGTDSVAAAAKAFHAKNKGDKARLELLWQTRRGGFVRTLQGTAEVTLR
jgi:S1-C subfamily serine protease